MWHHQMIVLPCVELTTEAHMWIFDALVRTYLATVSGDIGRGESWARCRQFPRLDPPPGGSGPGALYSLGSCPNAGVGVRDVGRPVLHDGP